MIFVTIGTQEPFDRLVRAIDEIASELEEDIIVQAPLKDYQPLNFKTFKFMDPGVFESNFKKADLIVSHAGMGTILLALELGKPLLIMPRQLKYQDSRNEHQMATAKILQSYNYVHVAKNEDELQRILRINIREKLKSEKKIGNFASFELLSSLRSFINS